MTDVRELTRAVLAGVLPPGWRGLGALDPAERDPFLVRWREVLRENRLLAYTWPREYGGGGGTVLDEVAIHEECARAGLPVWNDSDHFGIQMLGNTLLHRASDEQRRYFLPRILSGEDTWCQGYSEPDAGSDLSAIRTRGELVDGSWVVNGQKIWTTAAHRANWIFALVRTDPDSRKQAGISFLLIPLNQPGVDVRPVRTIAGSVDFNEVFFTDATTPAGNVVGPVGEGWSVAMTLLGFERGAEAGVLYLQFRDELDRLVDMAKESGRIEDPLIRQRLVTAHTKVEILRYLGVKAVNSLARDTAPGHGAAITKLWWSEYHVELTELALDVLGPATMTPTGEPSRTSNRADEAGAPNEPAGWVDVYLKARAGTIYAGTSEMQRNTIAVRVLGLPRGVSAR